MFVLFGAHLGPHKPAVGSYLKPIAHRWARPRAQNPTHLRAGPGLGFGLCGLCGSLAGGEDKAL
jgi:hypothetical protein